MLLWYEKWDYDKVLRNFPYTIVYRVGWKKDVCAGAVKKDVHSGYVLIMPTI